MKVFQGILIYVALLIFGAVLDGWILSTLWNWFVVSFFHLAQLPVYYAMGFVLIVLLFRKELIYEMKPSKFSGLYWLKLLLSITLNPILALCIGWGVHLLMR